MKSLIILLLFCTNIYAKDNKLKAYLGISYPNYIFTVKDASNNIEAKMVHSKTQFPTAGIGRLPDKVWGDYLKWSIEFSVAPFSSNRQIINRVTDEGLENNGDGKEVALATKIHGYVAYVNPTLDLVLPFNEDYYFLIGVGLGIGYANVWGNYYLTDANSSAACKNSTTVSTVISNCSIQNVKYDKVAASANVVFLLNLNHFAIRYDIGGPEVNQDNKKYSTYNAGVSLIYQFLF